MQPKRFMSAFWALAKPYWVSEERAKGLLLLAAVVGLTLGLVWINVEINLWYNKFYNAIQERSCTSSTSCSASSPCSRSPSSSCGCTGSTCSRCCRSSGARG